MDELAGRHTIAAWKTCTQWGPGVPGLRMDGDAGLAMMEKARKLGIRTIAIHKDLPFGRESCEHSTCRDIGRVARRFPDVNFLIYHAGLVAESKEGPYDPQRGDGVDALVTSLLENDAKPGSNTYAELVSSLAGQASACTRIPDRPVVTGGARRFSRCWRRDHAPRCAYQVQNAWNRGSSATGVAMACIDR
jgi:hypothetical protein